PLRRQPLRRHNVARPRTPGTHEACRRGDGPCPQGTHGPPVGPDRPLRRRPSADTRPAGPLGRPQPGRNGLGEPAYETYRWSRARVEATNSRHRSFWTSCACAFASSLSGVMAFAAGIDLSSTPMTAMHRDSRPFILCMEPTCTPGDLLGT